MERMWNTGRTIIRNVVSSATSNIAQKVFNTVSGHMEHGTLNWRDLFYSAAFAAQAAFTDAELNVTTYSGWGNIAKTVLTHYQEVIGNSSAGIDQLKSEIEHMRTAATKEARENMFISPINKKH